MKTISCRMTILDLVNSSSPRRESVLEITYRFQVTRWLSLQPDVQFIWDPHLSRRDATAIGLRAVVEL